MVYTVVRVISCSSGHHEMGRQLCDVVHPYLCLLGFQHHEGNPCLSIRGHGVPVDLVAHNATVLAADARAESPVGITNLRSLQTESIRNDVSAIFRYGFHSIGPGYAAFPRQKNCMSTVSHHPRNEVMDPGVM